MLISRISDEHEGEGNGIEVERVDSHEYQTANELFELMTKNQHFNDNDEDTLTTQDLVLLYKNIDIGTRLMTDATEVRRRKPNQHVETVVYNDEQESDSELSENFSTDNFHNIFKINQERLNLFDNGSFDNILCHKLGGLEIKSSDISAEYNKQFLFKDPYIKEQLKGINLMANCSEFDSILPTSLLDYICCKRLEDNYNFYMENIIKYVQHTIEQLKRISNGDYLTDRVKEKWEEVNNKDDMNKNGNTKVLATSTSIPLHVECKKRRNATWDDIVHSEVDVRSLSKILEKKIIVEIPKLICGSYRLFSKQCDENLIISCKRKTQEKDREDTSRVDVVLRLQRSQTGQVISNINSIMILQPSPAVRDLRIPETLPITFKNSCDLTAFTDLDYPEENSISVIECLDEEHIIMPKDVKEEDLIEMSEDRRSQMDESIKETNDYPYSDLECVVPYDMTSNQFSSETSVALADILVDKPGMFQFRHEADYNLISPDELRLAMIKLNRQSSLPEESAEDVPIAVSSKKKSPVRVRIKSPYENQSYIMEEKKRKRLLEIREKREKKKMALGEIAKFSRHNRIPPKSSVTPQASGSVTKLSITNKSFYNSIYGQNLNDAKPLKTKSHKTLKHDLLTLDVPLEQIQEKYFESPNLTPEKNGKKYINRSYYLDDTETAMMFMNQAEIKDKGNACSASTSAISDELSVNMTLLSHLIAPSDPDLNKDEIDEDKQNQSLDDDFQVFNNSEDACCSNDIPQAEIKVPENSPKPITNELAGSESMKVPVTVECRKSIDKLYDLMKKLGKSSSTDLKKSSSKQHFRTIKKSDATTGDSTIQGSDSGTSIKHHLTSSNPSCLSFGKTHPENLRPKSTRKKEDTANVVPKVIISSKLHAPKLEMEKLKKDRKKLILSQPQKTVTENPLRAISQLLHDFDSVQKTRQKITSDGKPLKKGEIACGDGKATLSRQHSFRRRSRIDEHARENEQDKKVLSPLDKRSKPLTPLVVSRIPHQQNADDKNIISKKKITDILDEAKEARGEAVRGPSKLKSRLNTLAQPKRSYVQAHSEEYQHKYGKNLMADRLQRLATATPPPLPLSEPIIRNLSSPISRNRIRREATSSVSVKQQPPSVQSIDKAGKMRRSNSSSPNRKSPPPAPTSHKHAVSDAPETLKKMVAVESYVNSHYGGKSTSPPRSELLLGGNKSRVPLLPSDLQLESSLPSSPAQEANELGKKLHRIVDSLVTTAPPLSTLSECQETTSKLTHDNRDDLSRDDLYCDYLSKDQHTDSEYNIDILEDKNVETAVESQDKHEKITDALSESSDALNLELQPVNSNTELEKLENALYNQISGAFQKRLRLKNLTLTPKQSLQQAFLLQSGDAGPLVVKSNGSSLKSKCDAESLNDIKTVPVLSNSHLSWNFAQIPMHITTVGYAFPLYQSDYGAKLDMSSLNVSSTAISVGRKSCKSDKISQCFKGVHQEPQYEQAAQVDVKEIVSSPKVTSKTDEIIAHSSEEHSKLAVEEFPIKIEYVTQVAEEKSLVEKKIEIYKNNETVQTSVSSSADNVDYTSSLDILVGLLNEIQKITCQNPGKDQKGMELETMLNNAASLEKKRPHGIISMTSLDRLRQLESNPSIYSYYISSEASPSSGCIATAPQDDTSKPVFVDKEVNVNIGEKECVNSFTNVPSVMPIVVNHSTNVTNSLIGVLSDPSSQSMVSFSDYSTLYSNTFFSSQNIKIIEMPQNEINEKPKESKKTDLNQKCSANIATLSDQIKRVQRSNSIIAHKIKRSSVKSIDFDCAIKIKRDILVTMYSILVFTVFAALSFPNMAII